MRNNDPYVGAEHLVKVFNDCSGGFGSAAWRMKNEIEASPTVNVVHYGHKTVHV
ncbi:hypothetical protein SAMN04488498_104310 [Mesorhizobium albiziae]|uniref:Uncharacterized protein n=1 Tax=Neomesorhizobium albiziae TaxID=335020 RepID=A0A1I3YAL2_9HYPH|nr:hypothetical protein SAMN04488498_104310 [Mesorhizobium albiziae]